MYFQRRVLEGFTGLRNRLLAVSVATLGFLLLQGETFAQVAEVEPNNTPASATPLDLSSGFASAAARIGGAGDADYFSFTAPPGSRVWILVDTGGVPAPGSGSDDSFLSLLAANGVTVIETDDDDGVGNGCDSTEESIYASAIAGRALVSGGTYFIRVNEFGDDSVLDPYKLFVVLTAGTAALEVEPNGFSAFANPLVGPGFPIGVRSGSVNPGGDQDFYSLDLLSGSTVHLSLDCDPERDGAGTDLALELRSTDGTAVLFATDGSGASGETAEAFCYTVPVSGVYYVRVTHAGGATGAYQVMAGIRPPGNLEFGAATYRVLEGGGMARVSVFRAGGGAGAVAVTYRATNNTAVSPGDFTAVTGTLQFPEGVTSNGFVVPIMQDAILEPNEIVTLTLSNPTGGAVLGAVSTALVVILDDDEIPNDTSVEATPLDLSTGFVQSRSAGDSGSLRISPGGDEDWYSFTAPPGARVWIQVDTGGEQHPGGDSLDSQVALFEADGATLIEEDDDDGSGNGCGPLMVDDGGLASAMAGTTLRTGGTYYIRVQAFDTQQIIDPYSLTVVLSVRPALSETEPNNNAGQADVIVGSSMSMGYRLGRIGVAGDADLYSVVAAADSVIFIGLDADPDREGVSTDLVAELVDVDGLTVLFAADSSGDEAAAAESFCYRVASPGVYYVKVRHFVDSEQGPSPSDVGPYGLLVARSVDEVEPNNSPVTAAGLDFIDALAMATGSVAPAGDEDYYFFQAPAGSRVWATVDTGGVQVAGAGTRDSVLTLFRADGVTVIEEDLNDGSGNGCDVSTESLDASAIGGRALTTGGIYYLRVKAANPGLVLAPYRLMVFLTPQGVAAETGANDTSATAETLMSGGASFGQRFGTLSSGSDLDFYALSLVAGNLLSVSLDGDPERNGESTDTVVSLIAADGSTVLYSANSSAGGIGVTAAEAFCFRIGSSGGYFLRVSSAASSTGTYHLAVARDFRELELTAVEVLGLDVRVSLGTLPGRNYRIERTGDLTAPVSWSVLPGTLTGTGQVEQYLDVGAGNSGAHYYRARQVP